MKNVLGKLPKKEISGASFHEKSEKNQKTNEKISRGAAAKLKYKKPKAARGKKMR
jgi:hypothetical protein